MARNVEQSHKYTDSIGEEAYAEVQFFFQAEIDEETRTLALIRRYASPDPELLDISSNTLWVSEELDDDTEMQVIEVQSISSVVGMVPFDDGRVFVVHKMGLEIGSLGGEEEIDTENYSFESFWTRENQDHNHVIASAFPSTTPTGRALQPSRTMRTEGHTYMSPLPHSRLSLPSDIRGASPAPSSSSGSSQTLSSAFLSPELSRTSLTWPSDLSNHFPLSPRPDDLSDFTRRHQDPLGQKSSSERYSIPLPTRGPPGSWNPAVAEATHESLLQNRNLDYMKLYDTHGKLEKQNEHLWRTHSELKARYETLNSSYMTLVNAVSDKLSNVSNTPVSQHDALAAPSTSKKHLDVLTHDDYPQISYWTEQDYLKEESERKKVNGKASMKEAQSKRGSRRLADDENVMLWFIEDQDGNSITGSRAKAARAKARQIWRYLHGQGRLSGRWNDADIVVRSYYAGEMRREFPELRLCEFDYKAHRIATMTFPNWVKNYKNPSSIKGEPDIEDDVSITKRSASDPPDGEPVSKKKDLGKPKQKTRTYNAPASTPSTTTTPIPPTRPPSVPLTRAPSIPPTRTPTSPTPAPSAPPVHAPSVPPSTASSTAVAPVMSSNAPGTSVVDDPLSFLGEGNEKKARKKQDGTKKSTTSLCLADYVAKHGKVTKEVFDPYWKSLSREELKGWEERSAAAKKGTTYCVRFQTSSSSTVGSPRAAGGRWSRMGGGEATAAGERSGKGGRKYGRQPRYPSIVTI
ncbi:hypothetical protein B0H13DRAFT_1853188 [Mycena leptocephala]|nr:hypothetical protein B0H13DRAFT_1853188 [Mycena leptocephala]